MEVKRYARISQEYSVCMRYGEVVIYREWKLLRHRLNMKEIISQCPQSLGFIACVRVV